MDLYEDGGRLTRAVLPASRESPTSAPVSRAAALSLLAHGWLARTTGRRLGGTRITSYRLSLRGWYAVRRTAPHMAAAPPPGKRPAAAPTEIAPPPASA